MKKRFIENLAFFLTLNILIKPFYVFGIDRVVQKTVGAEEYGSYFALFNLVLIVQIFLDFGIENFTRKEVGHNPALTNKLLSTLLPIKIILIFLFILVFSVAGLFLPQSKDEWNLLLILLFNQSMASFILYMRSNMGGLQLFKTEGIISVIDRLFMILICGSLLFIPMFNISFKLEWFVYAQTISYSITLLISLIIILRKTEKIKFRINITSYIPIIRKLKPFALLFLLMAFYFRIDSVFLRFFIPDGKEQAGIYAHGFRILDFMANYALIFSLILLPTFARMIRMKEKVASLLRLSVLSLTIPSFAVLTGIAFYRYEVFEMLYDESIQLSANTFLIFIISYAGVCFNYTFGALLTANGNLKQLNIMAAISVLLSIVLNIILIPKFEVIGAAITNASIQFFTIIVQFTLAKKIFSLKTDYILIVKIIVFIAFSVLAGVLISSLTLYWIIGCSIIIISSLFFAFAINLLRIEYIKELFNRKDLQE